MTVFCAPFTSSQFRCPDRNWGNSEYAETVLDGIKTAQMQVCSQMGVGGGTMGGTYGMAP